MEADDLYPSDGTWFGGVPTEPKDQVIARKKEKAQTLQESGVIEELLERLDKQIDFFESVSSIPDEVRTKPEEFLIMHNSHTMVADILQLEREFIKDLLDTYKKR